MALFNKVIKPRGFPMIDLDIREQNIADLSLDLLKILLSDKTTKKYIRWGSDNYQQFGPEYYTDQEIKPELITGNNGLIIQPRVAKSDKEQSKRVRDSAEVFTPAWICNEQNNLVDNAWFGRENIFNNTSNKSWTVTTNKISFPRDKIWKDYIDARRMEISCGEAPYLVSRYDAVSGEIIPLKDRIGILDRKMRIVNENVENDREWNQWTIRAFQSCYGYDFQGDNVLLARENMLYSFQEYYVKRYGQKPLLREMKKIANIVAWNIWQMNGITCTSPYSLAEPAYKQLNIFQMLGEISESEDSELINEMPSKIFDWRSHESIEFKSLMNEDQK